jgi:hypothetical protein
MPAARSRIPPRADTVRRRPIASARLGGGKQRRLMMGDERVDDFAERDAFHDLRQLMERQIDAMIGDAPLRKL